MPPETNHPASRWKLWLFAWLAACVVVAMVPPWTFKWVLNPTNLSRENYGLRYSPVFVTPSVRADGIRRDRKVRMVTQRADEPAPATDDKPRWMSAPLIVEQEYFEEVPTFHGRSVGSYTAVIDWPRYLIPLATLILVGGGALLATRPK
jgi:hypothetical protein